MRASQMVESCPGHAYSADGEGQAGAKTPDKRGGRCRGGECQPWCCGRKMSPPWSRLIGTGRLEPAATDPMSSAWPA